MSSFAKVQILGRLGKDPVINNPTSDKAVCHFSVAADQRVKVNGEWTDRTQWFNVTTFKKDADNCALYLGKGALVLVDGTLDVREYEKDGVKRFSLDVIADIRGVQFLTKKEGSAAPSTNPAPKNGAPTHTEDDIPPF